MTFWRFWSLSERLGEFFAFFHISLSRLVSSRRMFVWAVGAGQEDYNHPTRNTRNNEKGERWMVMQTHRQKGVDADTLCFFLQSSPLSTEKKSVLLEIGDVVLVVDSISVYDLEWIFLSEPFLT